jgi:hypothetical protein
LGWYGTDVDGRILPHAADLPLLAMRARVRATNSEWGAIEVSRCERRAAAPVRVRCVFWLRNNKISIGGIGGIGNSRRGAAVELFQDGSYSNTVAGHVGCSVSDRVIPPRASPMSSP